MDILFKTNIINNYKIFNIKGDSMNPTLKNDNKVLTKKQKKYNVGDVVVFAPPFNSKYAVKRISAIKNNKYFMLSDNKRLKNTCDSRNYGYIEYDKIIGKVVKIYD